MLINIFKSLLTLFCVNYCIFGFSFFFAVAMSSSPWFSIEAFQTIREQAQLVFTKYYFRKSQKFEIESMQIACSKLFEIVKLDNSEILIFETLRFMTLSPWFSIEVFQTIRQQTQRVFTKYDFRKSQNFKIESMQIACSKHFEILTLDNSEMFISRLWDFETLKYIWNTTLDI